MDDPTLIDAVLAGEGDAFRTLVERYQGLVFAIARSCFHNDPRVEDIAQEVFLAAYGALARYRPERGTVAAWLGTIARNRCRDELRKRTEPVGASTVPDRAALAGDGGDAEVHARLDDALARLPAERRLAFLLVEVHGLSNEQVAEIEDVAVGTVRSRVSRARTALRALLQPQEEDV